MNVQLLCDEDESMLITTYLPESGYYCPILMRKSVEQSVPCAQLSSDSSQPGSSRIRRNLKACVTLSGPWRAASSEGHFAAMPQPRWRGLGGEAAVGCSPVKLAMRDVCCESAVLLSRGPPTSWGESCTSPQQRFVFNVMDTVNYPLSLAAGEHSICLAAQQCSEEFIMECTLPSSLVPFI